MKQIKPPKEDVKTFRFNPSILQHVNKPERFIGSMEYVVNVKIKDVREYIKRLNKAKVGEEVKIKLNRGFVIIKIIK